MANYCASCLEETSRYKTYKRKISSLYVPDGELLRAQATANAMSTRKKQYYTEFYSQAQIPMCKTCENLESTKGYKYSLIATPILFVVLMFIFVNLQRFEIPIFVFILPVLVRVISHVRRLSDNMYIHDPVTINRKGDIRFRNTLYVLLKRGKVQPMFKKRHLIIDIIQLIAYVILLVYTIIILTTVTIVGLSTYFAYGVMGVSVLLAILSLILSIRLYRVVPKRLKYKIQWIENGTLSIPQDHKEYILLSIKRYLV